MIFNKTINNTIFILLSLLLTIIGFKPNPSKAFFPTINEPNTEELKSTSIEIGKNAIQLIQLGEIEDATNLLKLATQLNPDEEILWIGLADAQIKSNKHKEAFKHLKSIKVAVNKNFADFDTLINEKDEIAFFPPVTGG